MRPRTDRAVTGPGPEPARTDPLAAGTSPPASDPLAAGTSPPATKPGAAGTPPPAANPAADPDQLPLRVTTLELFFDLVFAFTLTQLASLLASGFTAGAVARVLLIFGLLWWMYEGYAWLTNARPPVRTAERLLLLVGMAGFLTIGLAIPDGFGGASLALGLGYLAVVLVHAGLYFRVNRNIVMVAPFNVASALLVIVAALVRVPGGGERPAGYVLWVVALAVQLGSPLIVHPKNLFDLRPAHMSERHSDLILVALGESVAAIGVGAGRLAGRSAADDARIIVAAVLGLALAAALWWIVFGSSDEDEAERVLTEASSERRITLALGAFFYSNIPLLLGLVAMAAGVEAAIERSGTITAGPAGAAVALAAGAAAFLAGDAAIRRLLRIGPMRLRAAAAALALLTALVGAFVALEVQVAVLALLLAGTLVLERNQRLSGPHDAADE
jgi:low temperature requirement protein LtrA